MEKKITVDIISVTECVRTTIECDVNDPIAVINICSYDNVITNDFINPTATIIGKDVYNNIYNIYINSDETHIMLIAGNTQRSGMLYQPNRYINSLRINTVSDLIDRVVELKQFDTCKSQMYQQQMYQQPRPQFRTTTRDPKPHPQHHTTARDLTEDERYRYQHQQSSEHKTRW